MQKNEMADKKQFYVDGELWGDVINVGEGNSEKDTVEVANGRVKRSISNGQKSVTPRECSLAISRDASYKRMLYDWYENDEIHDVTIVSIDGHGVEFERELLQDCEISKVSRPAYDALSATQAKADFTILPYSSVTLDS